jgi:transcription initiation factor TFIIIB Brf1 subunit/transcription initiation factor TFIIB
MASLKKPTICGYCTSKNIVHKYDPERWECVDCGKVLAQRAQRIAGICRKCGASEKDKPFKKGKNLCLDCHNKYMVEWRLKNPEWNDSPEFKKKRFDGVRRAIQKSPESFIKHLYLCLTRPSRKRKKRHNTEITPKRLAMLNDIHIDLDYLIDLYHKQDGKCAITGIEMCHIFGNPRTISIDRIDSNQGYIEGNVHLVCQWVNLAKSKYSLDVFQLALKAFLDTNTLVEQRVETDKIPLMLLPYHNYVKKFSRRSCWFRHSDDTEDCYETMLIQLVDPAMEWKEPQEIEREKRQNERHYFEMSRLKDFDSVFDWMKWCKETRDPEDNSEYEDREEDYDTVHVVYNKEGIRVWRYFFNNEYNGCPEPVAFIPWYAENFFKHLDNALSVPAETPKDD